MRYSLIHFQIDNAERLVEMFEKELKEEEEMKRIFVRDMLKWKHPSIVCQNWTILHHAAANNQPQFLEFVFEEVLKRKLNFHLSYILYPIHQSDFCLMLSF